MQKTNNYHLTEDQLGKGLKEQLEDKRDIQFASVAPFDWELDFDIELLLGFRAICKNEDEFFGKRGRNGWGYERYKEIVDIVSMKKIKHFSIPVKNQGSSSSCSGQGLSYYLEILNFIETQEYIKISARDVYAYISLGENKGAYLRSALKLACNRGIGNEELVPCYHGEKPYTEKEYLIKPEETEALMAVRKVLQSKEYQIITGYKDELMEKMAWAMLMGFGAYFGVNGQNGKGWLTEYPSPPDNVNWKHALFGGKAKLENKEKTIGLINSWGNDCGVNGWQKLKSNYFTTNNILTPWTLIDNSNNYNIMSKSNCKIIKDQNSSAVGIWLPATSPEALKSYCNNFGIEIPKKEDGTIDWEKWIDGELIINT